jgi:shikimate dehydrogenase
LKLYGNLILTVSIRADGSVEKVIIERSSGHRVLDAAAQRIVEMAAPYSPFPSDIRRDTEILDITRTWTFAAATSSVVSSPGWSRAKPGAGPMTDRYAVVGNPIAHSKSPEIHDAFARATGHDLTYERLLAPLDGFVATVEAFAARAASAQCDRTVQARSLRARARAKRACRQGRCVQHPRAPRRTIGTATTTDGVGVVRDLTHNLGVALGGRDLLVLGAGGANRGILGPLLAEKAALARDRQPHARARGPARHDVRRGRPIRAAGVDAVGAQRFDVVIDATSAALAQLAATDATAALPWPTTIFARDALALRDRIVTPRSLTAVPALGRLRGRRWTLDRTGSAMLIEQAGGRASRSGAVDAPADGRRWSRDCCAPA